MHNVNIVSDYIMVVKICEEKNFSALLALFVFHSFLRVINLVEVKMD